MTTLEAIEAALPWGLHDAYLERMEIDWVGQHLMLTVRVMISERQDMDQRALVTIAGLVFCAIDAPEIDPARGYEPCPPHGLWIDVGTGAANEHARATLPPTPNGCFLSWIFVQNWNRFIHVCAQDATMTWIDPAPVPARGTPRALYPGDETDDPPNAMGC
jgi:hypothetical protein